MQIPDIDLAFCLALWQETVFDLLVREEKIGQDVVRNTGEVYGFTVGTVNLKIIFPLKSRHITFW